MKRLLCGSVVLAASLGLVSCSGDPTSDFQGTPTRIVAEPTSLFIDQADDADVIVTLQDDQGNPLAGVVEVTAQGNGITVAKNENFLGTTVGVPLQSQAQFIVTAGDAPTPSSFTLTAGELEIDIPVVVLPTVVPSAVFSNATPALNELVTVTAEGYSFLPEASVVIGGDSALIISNDGTSLTFLPAPGGTGTAQLGGIAINFLPTTPLSVPTAAEIAVAPISPIPGTDAPATAPEVPVPAVGEISGFFDGPDFAGGAPCAFGTICRFYNLTVTEEGVYTITVNWDIGGDLDVYLCPAPGDITDDCDFQAATGAHPEVVESALLPGTYTVVVDDFGGDAAGTQLSITVQHDPPEQAGLRLPPAPYGKVRK